MKRRRQGGRSQTRFRPGGQPGLGLGSLEPRLLLDGAAAPSLLAPPTPIFSKTYDLGNISRLLPNGAGQPERPFSIAFDRTTQTFYVVLQGGFSGPEPNGGNRIIQIDPASNTARVINLQGVPIAATEPHGSFFDFESHLTPRLWFTRRPKDIPKNLPVSPSQGGGLSYIDLTTNQLITYDLKGLLRAAKMPDLVGNYHGVTVDRTGTAWVSSTDDRRILELNFHHTPDGKPTTGPDSKVGTLTVHPVPASVLGSVPMGAGYQMLGPHGLETVVDDRTGQVYVWLTFLGSARIALLRPGAGPGGADLWASWDMTPALSAEQRVGGGPLFTSINNNETPNHPQDDVVDFGDAGMMGGGGPNDVIRELDPRNLFTDPSATSSPVLTWKIPSTTAAGAPAQPYMTFLDRLGRILYVDRQQGIGRLDPTEPGLAARLGAPLPTIRAPLIRATSRTVSTLLTPLPAYQFGPAVTVSLATTEKVTPASGPTAGLDQYDVTDTRIIGTGSEFPGPIRGQLSPGDVVFSSLNGSDTVVSSIFAETSQRPMTVVPSPGGGRMAFQVLRNGDLIMTARADGQLNDRQVDLTRSIHGPAIVGDASAVADASGVVDVFGRDTRGSLSEYLFNRKTGLWTTLKLGPMPATAGVAAADPTAFVDPRLGAEAVVTTGDGHLVLFDPRGTATDLSEQPGWGDVPVYSKVGAAVVGGRVQVDATDQTGALVQASWPVGGGAVAVRRIVLPGGLQVFQDVSAVASGSVAQVFATDGAGRLIHVTVGPPGVQAEDVSAAGQRTAAGYSAYQQPFAGRVLSDVAPLVAPDGTLYVYGTNGRDLVEFLRPPGGPWRIRDLTNALPANRVSGGPAAYLTPDGLRHVLSLNDDAEVVEYYNMAPGEKFSTQNITLASGDSGSPPSFPVV